MNTYKFWTTICNVLNEYLRNKEKYLKNDVIYASYRLAVICHIEVMHHIDYPLAFNTFGKLPYESVITDDDFIAVLLKSARWRSTLEVRVFKQFTESFENVRANCNFYESFLNT